MHEDLREESAVGVEVIREGIELAELIAEIDEPSIRKEIASLVRSLAEKHRANKT